MRTTSRIPHGDTDDSDNDANATDTSTPIAEFQRSEAWLDEYKEAAQDPQRTLAAHELSDDHTWNLATDLSRSEKKLMKEFKDEMYTVLSQQYTTYNGSTIRIEVVLDVPTT